jgi:hypothetical protein
MDIFDVIYSKMAMVVKNTGSGFKHRRFSKKTTKTHRKKKRQMVKESRRNNR